MRLVIILFFLISFSNLEAGYKDLNIAGFKLNQPIAKMLDEGTIEFDPKNHIQSPHKKKYMVLAFFTNTHEFDGVSLRYRIKDKKKRLKAVIGLNNLFKLTLDEAKVECRRLMKEKVEKYSKILRKKPKSFKNTSTYADPDDKNYAFIFLVE